MQLLWFSGDRILGKAVLLFCCFVVLLFRSNMNDFLIVYEIQARSEVLLSLQGIQSSFKGSELSRMLWGKRLDSFFS